MKVKECLEESINYHAMEHSITSMDTLSVLQ